MGSWLVTWFPRDTHSNGSPMINDNAYLRRVFPNNIDVRRSYFLGTQTFWSLTAL